MIFSKKPWHWHWKTQFFKSQLKEFYRQSRIGLARWKDLVAITIRFAVLMVCRQYVCLSSAGCGSRFFLWKTRFEVSRDQKMLKRPI